MIGAYTSYVGSSSSVFAPVSSPAPIKPAALPPPPPPAPAPTTAPAASAPAPYGTGTSTTMSAGAPSSAVALAVAAKIAPVIAQQVDHAEAQAYAPQPQMPSLYAQGVPAPHTDTKKWIFIGALVLGVYFLTEGQ